MKGQLYGTIAWGELTRGNLRTGDKIRQLLGLIGIQLDEILHRRRPVAIELNFNALTPPDTAEARRATELCYGESTEALAAHCLRTYFWGAIIAQLENRDYDRELYYVTAMMHDLALTQRFEFSGRAHLNCFALEGADIALDEMHDWSWSAQRKQASAEAIALHLNSSVPAGKFGTEAYLLHESAMLDVAGIRAARIHPFNRAQVYERAARGDFLGEIQETAARHADHRPGCRIAFLHRNGFAQLARKADAEATEVSRRYAAISR